MVSDWLVASCWWLAAGLAGCQRGEHTGLGEVLHENPRQEACDNCAGDDGARYVDVYKRQPEDYATVDFIYDSAAQ